jgi:hypothetical protein
MEVIAWIGGGPEPATVTEAIFRPARLLTMRTRLSAAYKGIMALLIQKGALDFRSGQSYDDTAFFEEKVDIHHIFPKKWCKTRGIDRKVYDSVVNKTPLGYRTNRTIGGDAPSLYLGRLERGTATVPPIRSSDLDSYLASHLVDSTLLRQNQFLAFFEARAAALLELIETATGKRTAQRERSGALLGDYDDRYEEDEETEEPEEAEAEAA